MQTHACHTTRLGSIRAQYGMRYVAARSGIYVCTGFGAKQSMFRNGCPHLRHSRRSKTCQFRHRHKRPHKRPHKRHGGDTARRLQQDGDCERREGVRRKEGGRAATTVAKVVMQQGTGREAARSAGAVLQPAAQAQTHNFMNGQGFHAPAVGAQLYERSGFSCFLVSAIGTQLPYGLCTSRQSSRQRVMSWAMKCGR
eukprot:366278-Chlamydomonas_euryale.AAC.9